MIAMSNNMVKEIKETERPSLETKGEIEMAYVLSDNARAVLSFLQSNPQVELTKAELAEQTGVPAKSVPGVVLGLKKRGLVDDPEREFEEGKVKIVSLTADGAAFDVLTEKPAKTPAE